MTSKLISIIIPSYNSAEFIKETVESALDQSYKNIEVLVIDDGSKDNTKEILEPYVDRITYIYQNNQGESVARNNGLKLAKGEYIMYLDSDDLLEPDAIQSALETLKNNPEYKVAYGIRRTFSKKKSNKNVSHPKPSVSGNLFPSIVTGITLVPGQFLVKKSCLEDIGGFREDMQMGEDWEFLLRLSNNCQFVFVSKVFLNKRVHANMQTLSDERQDIVKQRQDILKELFKDEFEEIKKKFLTPQVIADWYRTFGFSYADNGNFVKAKEYVYMSLKTWAFQPVLWIWTFNRWLKGNK